MLIQKPNQTSKLVSFSSAAIDHLWHNRSSRCGIAGVSAGGFFKLFLSYLNVQQFIWFYGFG
jgi:hypothetical protein